MKVFILLCVFSLVTSSIFEIPQCTSMCSINNPVGCASFVTAEAGILDWIKDMSCYAGHTQNKCGFIRASRAKCNDLATYLTSIIRNQSVCREKSHTTTAGHIADSEWICWM